ncbi:MAG: hypothetical protein WBP61_15755 [Nocardioides sp.]
MPQPPDNRWPVLFLVLLAMVGLIVIAWGVDEVDGAAPDPAGSLEVQAKADESESDESDESGPEESDQPTDPGAVAPRADRSAALPGGGRRIFGRDRFLVAYYGTGQTASMGVLGESPPDTMDRRLRRAAAPFRRAGRPVQHVYELIVTVADASPGPDGDYSHDVPREVVETYVRAARRNGALLLLDIQPGRSGFLETAQRWAWALREPWVGLALDPEWRMGLREVPGRTIGQVSAAEVNRTSAWLARLTRDEGLPEKLFVLHQFRADMVADVGAIRSRDGLAMVQHVDGFGTPQQKRATYHAVARPQRFTMGFKLFYDEDVRRMGPREVHAIRPQVRFVSFQ